MVSSWSVVEGVCHGTSAVSSADEQHYNVLALGNGDGDRQRTHNRRNRGLHRDRVDELLNNIGLREASGRQRARSRIRRRFVSTLLRGCIELAIGAQET